MSTIALDTLWEVVPPPTLRPLNNCLRCGYVWHPHKDSRNLKCPICQSRYWDGKKPKPRKAIDPAHYETLRIARTVPAGLGPTALAKLWGVSRQRADQIVHRDKARARHAVTDALASGALEKPKTCDLCHRRKHDLEAHHADYSQRLAVRWLCPLCHSKEHPHPNNLPKQVHKRPCSRCGILMVSLGMTQKRICQDCKAKIPSALVTLTCKQCGMKFQRGRYQVRRPHSPGVLCSKQCQGRWLAHHRKPKNPETFKTHCKYGHPFDASNTLLIRNNPRVRVCRACAKIRRSRYTASRPERQNKRVAV